tara:strand:- start:129 stop:356 length:228 start_codon:yes stop_codon:yes gene_type:complete
LQKARNTYERPWFAPLLVALFVLAAGTIYQDALRLIPGTSISAPPLLKYIFAIGLGIISYIGGRIGKRQLEDAQD